MRRSITMWVYNRYNIPLSLLCQQTSFFFYVPISYSQVTFVIDDSKQIDEHETIISIVEKEKNVPKDCQWRTFERNRTSISLLWKQSWSFKKINWT